MMSEWSMTPNHALHPTLNQRRFACWFRAAERWPLGVQKRTNQGFLCRPGGVSSLTENHLLCSAHLAEWLQC